MKHYCHAPFLSPSITPDGFMYCTQPGQKVYSDISFWNSDEVKQLRQEIIDGKIPETCKDCKSVRHGLVTSEVAPTEVEVPLNFEHLYIARSNKCEYACDMCSATVSHTYDKIHNEGRIGIIENNFDLTPYLSGTRHAAISGGNPVLDRKLLDIIKQFDVEKMERIIITSNGSVFPKPFLDALKRFKCEIGLIFSIDGPKEFNEKVRRGAKQERIYSTINKTLAAVKDHDNITVAVEYTFTSKSVHHYVDLYDEMLFCIEREYLDDVYLIGNACGYPANLSMTQMGSTAYHKLVNDALPYFQQQPLALAYQFETQLKLILTQYQQATIM